MNREVHNEQEMLDKDEQAVRRLVAGLKNVEAPANFERRVMARIASGEPKSTSLVSFPAFAYTVPALIVVLVATFFVFKLRQPTVAQPGPETVAANVSSTPSKSENPLPENTLTVAPDPEAPAIAKVSEKPSPKSKVQHKGGSFDVPETTDPNRPGSYVKGQGQTQLPLPEGVNPKASIAVKSMLDNAGMSVEFDNGWQVKSVTENGIAQSAGIKTGDVITALDGRSIDSTTSYKGTASFQTITVRRGGTLILLRITPR
jgi:membrane-associated protease RseP (regulator of RpoE activity)